MGVEKPFSWRNSCSISGELALDGGLGRDHDEGIGRMLEGWLMVRWEAGGGRGLEAGMAVVVVRVRKVAARKMVEDERGVIVERFGSGLVHGY